MKIFIIACVVLLIIALLFLFVYYQDNHLVVSEYTYANNDIQTEFDGYRIVQLSDLHDKQFGQSQETLISYIHDINPDAIFLTGDFVTAKSIVHTEELVRELSSKYEMFFVPGNHEAGYVKYADLKEVLSENQVHILENEVVSIAKGNSSINVVGLLDTSFYKRSAAMNAAIMDETVQTLTENLEGATLLLAHRPEYINTYSKHNINLVFSGHAHGGQFILPFVGSVYAPGQGLFPKLTQGKHDKNGTTLIISRGLGNLAPVPRLFNYPEIVVVTLHNT